eukprot:EC824443.1.p1 GENE.EC824443.1~~EC824443.1.p1  ORF type:complete len:224 (+),score=74.55 EC824443.1:39-674(+)
MEEKEKTAKEEKVFEKQKIYTKTGDKGFASLYNKERKRKDELDFEALGTVDELNSNLGLARYYCKKEQNKEIKVKLHDQLVFLQSRMLDLGSLIATPPDNSSIEKINKVKFKKENVDILEKWIDEMDSNLPNLTNFILPGGSLCASQLHVCRTICRRAERRIVTLYTEGKVHDDALQFMNRLSDFLFMAARYSSKLTSETDIDDEIIYQKQ